MKCIKCKDNIASTDGFCWKCSSIEFVIDKPNNMQSEEFEELDKFLIEEDGKQFISQHFLPKSVVREKIEKMEINDKHTTTLKYATIINEKDRRTSFAKGYNQALQDLLKDLDL